MTPDFPEDIPVRPTRTDGDPYGRRTAASAPVPSPVRRRAVAPEPEPAPALSARDRILRAVIEAGLLALLVFSPLPIGSVEDFPIMIIEIAAVGLTFLYFLMDRPPHINASLRPKLKWPRLAFGLLLAFMLLQIAPLPTAIVRILSPHALALRQQFLPAGPGGAVSLSLVPTLSIKAFLLIGAYVLVGFLVVRTVTHARQVRRLMAVLIGMGVFEVLYGLYELTQKAPRVLWYPKTFHLESASGTFVNRNHFSGYLEMIVPLAIGLLLSRVGAFGLTGKNWREKIAGLAAKGSYISLLLLSATFLLSVGILKSNSRSGLLILGFSLILASGLTMYAFSTFRSEQMGVRRFMKGIVGMTVLLMLYFGVDATVRRFSTDNLLQEGRPKYWANVLTMVGDFPVFGAGHGAFPSVFAAYEDPGLENPLIHAHNDYLEALAELGLIGFGLLMAGIFFLYVIAFRTWSQRHNPEVKGLVLGCLVSIAAMLFHSITDFNMHIPSNALLFTVVLSLAFGTAFYRKAQ